jgi:antitoxin VapB
MRAAGSGCKHANMAYSKVFLTSKWRQLIRLPKAVALPRNVKLVDIVAIGRRRIISPA